MKYYAVIDTNVIVSAMYKRDSVPGRVMEYVFRGELIPLTSHLILREYLDVLSRSKFHFSEDHVKTIVNMIITVGKNVDPVPTEEILPDPKDTVFYEVAMEGRKAGDAKLVTGNIKHFPDKPFVVTPRQMLDILEGRESSTQKE